MPSSLIFTPGCRVFGCPSFLIWLTEEGQDKQLGMGMGTSAHAALGTGAQLDKSAWPAPVQSLI